MLVPGEVEGCVAFLKKHFQECFPNRKEAPRLSAPSVRERKLISPFYCHFVFPALIYAGEIDFVVEQMRSCWGWMLEEGRTTWLEVFDTRWFHCHQWSGCPTWILSRYLLGLHPRADLGAGHFDFRLNVPESLEHVSGFLPDHRGGEKIGVQWERAGREIHFSVNTEQPIWLHVAGQAAPMEVIGPWELWFQAPR